MICFIFYRFQTDVLNTTLSALFNETSRTTDTNIGILYPLVIILPVIFLLGLIIAVVAWKMKRRIKIVKKNGCKNTDFLIPIH